MSVGARFLARQMGQAAAMGAVVPAVALVTMTIATGGSRSAGHGGNWGSLIYLYLGAGGYLIAFLLHPVLVRARSHTGSFLVGAAFGAGGFASVVIAGLALGELRMRGDAAEASLKVLASLVAHGVLALPLAGLLRLVRGAPDEEELVVETGGPLAPLALVLLSLALSLGATGVLVLALFATGMRGRGLGAWLFAATPFVLALAVAAWRLRQRLVPRWRALVFGASFGGWVAALVCAWYVTEARPRDFEDWVAPLLVALATPALAAGLAALAAHGAIKGSSART